MEDQEHSMPDISDIDRFRGEPPFFGTLYDLGELIDVANRCIERVQGSTSPRSMVVETWLLVDYCIRELLLSAFDLKPFNHDECDLRYDFLPASFWECTRKLQRILKVHKGVKPRPPKEVKSVGMTLGFMRFFQNYDSNAFDQLSKAQQAYLKKYHPDLPESYALQVSADSYRLPVALVPRRYISEGWLEVVQRLSDASWFDKAERLNDARNLAAHRYEEEKILSRLGISGPDAVEHARRYCLEMIEQLVGIVLKSEVADND